MVMINLRSTQQHDQRSELLVIGGKGNDTFDMKGRVIIISMILKPKNFIEHKRRSKSLFQCRPHGQLLQHLGFNYPVTRFPKLGLGYLIAEDGVLATALGFFKDGPMASGIYLMQRTSTICSYTCSPWHNMLTE